MRDLIQIVEASAHPAKLELIPLPYELKALDPVLSKENLNCHYEHLARGYVKRYNKGEGDAAFNRAGAFLHNVFFPQLQPPKGANRPNGPILTQIEEKFKTYDDFKDQFIDKAMSIQGSGWCYLSTSGEIKIIRNHAIRNDICMLVDMWEHSWLLDYEWDKQKYLNNIWKIINWTVCSDRL